jgi:hypothetical protein
VGDVTREELEAGVDAIRAAPKDLGLLQLIVRRPAVGDREVLDEGLLDLLRGLVGDNWAARGSSRTADGSAHPDMQLNIMGARAIALIARDKERWPLAGDQLFIDMDLSEGNMPPGTQLSMGSAIVEITDIPHIGCEKFHRRFGLEATKFVNSPQGKALRLRGLNAKVIQSGTVRVGDIIRKQPAGRQADVSLAVQ